MTKIRAFTISLLVCCVSTPQLLLAQKAVPAADNKALLFEIFGNGLTKPSYIYGTFHVLCPSDLLPMEKFTPFIDSTDQMIMEIDMDDPAEMGAMTKGAMITDGRTIKDVLSAEQYAKVDEMFKTTMGSSIEPLKMLKPSILGVLVLTSPKMLGCSPLGSYEMNFIKVASEKKKPIAGLETVAFQSKALDSRPLEKQALSLVEISKDPQKSAESLKKLIAVYKEQDADKLRSAALEQEKSDPEFNKAIIDDRNASWIPKIEALIKERPSFIAVGGGHLGGEPGVIRLLRSRGYTVRPIRL
jgi:uncharacterized protein YbaP (TraB family)